MEPFIIPISLIGPTENVSTERVRRIVNKLEAAGEIEVRRSPTKRNRLNISGYIRVREAIRTGEKVAV